MARRLHFDTAQRLGRSTWLICRCQREQPEGNQKSGNLCFGVVQGEIGWHSRLFWEGEWVDSRLADSTASLVGSLSWDMVDGSTV